MKISFYGHAATILKNKKNIPILATDPWIIGSCYWRSWWLENPLTPSQIKNFMKVKFIYVTHEHPDHFHFPSIKLIGKSPIYLFADQSHKTNYKFMKSNGFKTKELESYKWIKIDNDIKIMSIPNWNDDSCLITLTPSAIIINMNDSRFAKRRLKKISNILDEFNLPRILCQSYSPASFIFNFFHNKKRLKIVSKTIYINMALDNCNYLKANYFVPFASQNIFLRDDSSWANEFKVRYSDLEMNWKGPTKLLEPYCELLIDKKEIKYQKNKHQTLSYLNNIKARETEKANKQMILEVDEACRLIKEKFNTFSLLILLLFPRGIKFCLDSKQNFIYFPFSRTAKLEKKIIKSSITFHTSAQPFLDSLKFNHFNDLSISMFTKVIVRYKNIDPWLVYFLFVLIEFSDHEHFDNFTNFFKFLKKNVKRL